MTNKAGFADHKLSTPEPRDPVLAFEEYWGASKYRSRNMIGYSEKKCLAWEAYSAALQSRSPSIESEIERLGGRVS